jgi:hypothetical protein
MLLALSGAEHARRTKTKPYRTCSSAEWQFYTEVILRWGAGFGLGMLYQGGEYRGMHCIRTDFRSKCC